MTRLLTQAEIDAIYAEYPAAAARIKQLRPGSHTRPPSVWLIDHFITFLSGILFIEIVHIILGNWHK